MKKPSVPPSGVSVSIPSGAEKPHDSKGSAANLPSSFRKAPTTPEFSAGSRVQVE